MQRTRKRENKTNQQPAISKTGYMRYLKLLAVIMHMKLKVSLLPVVIHINKYIPSCAFFSVFAAQVDFAGRSISLKGIPGNMEKSTERGQWVSCCKIKKWHLHKLIMKPPHPLGFLQYFFKLQNLKHYVCL